MGTWLALYSICSDHRFLSLGGTTQTHLLHLLLHQVGLDCASGCVLSDHCHYLPNTAICPTCIWPHPAASGPPWPSSACSTITLPPLQLQPWSHAKVWQPHANIWFSWGPESFENSFLTSQMKWGIPHEISGVWAWSKVDWNPWVTFHWHQYSLTSIVLGFDLIPHILYHMGNGWS